MTALLVKSSVAMIGALLLVVAARRSRASLRHLILAALFAFLLLLPAVQWMAPALPIPAPESVGGWRLAVGGSEPESVDGRRLVVGGSEPTSSASSSTANRQLPTANSLIATYLVVASLLLAWLAIGVLRLRRLANDAEVWVEGTTRMNEIAHEASIRRSALVVLSRDVAVPLTFGFRRSTIVVPYAALSWSSDELTRALRHELEHVRREDWILQLAARAACALYWPHPLVWTAWRRFCLEAERACDDAVIRSSEPAAYAGQLVSLARDLRRLTMLPALGMASRSKLAQRIDAILDPKQRRGPHGVFSAATVFALLLALLVCVAPARLIAAAADVVQSESFNPDPDFNFDLDFDGSPVGEALVKLAEKGDIESLRKLLDSGVDVNTVAHGDGTALIGAARGGQLRTIEFLLDRKADPNVACRGDGSPLIAAAEGGHVDIVLRLLAAGAKIDEIVPGDENPLMGSSRQGQSEVVRLLIERGADVNAETWADGELRSPLRLARRSGNAEIVKMLIEAGAKG